MLKGDVFAVFSVFKDNILYNDLVREYSSIFRTKYIYKFSRVHSYTFIFNIVLFVLA